MKPLKLTGKLKYTIIMLLVLIPIMMSACKKQDCGCVLPPQPKESPQSLTAKPVGISQHINGYYEYLPVGYSTDTGNTKYPLVLFFHGSGEMGNGSTDLAKVMIHGPLKYINSSNFPEKFTIGGKVYKFIIIAPQLNSTGIYPDEIDQTIEYVKQHYKVDDKRIYLTGLSMGGAEIWNYAGKSLAAAQKIAAMVPVAAYLPEYSLEHRIDSSKAQHISASNLPIWSLHNSGDPVSNITYVINAHTSITLSKPLSTHLPILTTFNSIAHDSWTKAYDPTFKENGMNVYEWMLQYSR